MKNSDKLVLRFKNGNSSYHWIVFNFLSYKIKTGEFAGWTQTIFINRKYLKAINKKLLKVVVYLRSMGFASLEYIFIEYDEKNCDHSCPDLSINIYEKKFKEILSKWGIETYKMVKKYAQTRFKIFQTKLYLKEIKELSKLSEYKAASVKQLNGNPLTLLKRNSSKIFNFQKEFYFLLYKWLRKAQSTTSFMELIEQLGTGDLKTDIL
jgi:hypothetical protein